MRNNKQFVQYIQISKQFGENGLSNDRSIRINLIGHAGQSFGAFLVKGVSLYLEGDANDCVGKVIDTISIFVKLTEFN